MKTSIGRFALASALALSLSLTAVNAQTSPAPKPLLATVEQRFGGDVLPEARALVGELGVH